MELEKLEALVNKMRELGVTEYVSDGITIKLGTKPVPMNELTEAEQQRIRDEREKARLERQRRIMFAASSRISAKPGAIK